MGCVDLLHKLTTHSPRPPPNPHPPNVGLLAGVSLAVKTLKPDCKVIGVEPKNCRSFEAALKHGKPVTAEVKGTLADGLAVPMVS